MMPDWATRLQQRFEKRRSTPIPQAPRRHEPARRERKLTTAEKEARAALRAGEKMLGARGAATRHGRHAGAKRMWTSAVVSIESLPGPLMGEGGGPGPGARKKLRRESITLDSG